jgi:hypothetical protein
VSAGAFDQSVRWGPAAALALLVTLTFGGVLANGFVWDDRSFVLANEALRRPDVVVKAFQVSTWQLADPMHPPDSFYRPLGVLSLALDAWAGGLSPIAFHLSNLLLHLAVVLLLFLLLVRRGAGRWPAFAAAAWFGTLPAAVEAVAWISARFELLGAALALFALLVHRSERRGAHVATPLLVLAAMLTKETFIVLPLLLVLDDWLESPLAARSVRAFVRGHAVRHAALVLAAISFLALRARAVSVSQGVLTDRTLSMLAVDALSTLAGMARLAVSPLPLTVTRPYVPLEGWGLVASLAGALAAGVAAWRVPRLRLGLAWFAIGCALTSLAVRPLGFFGERYLYFPALGLAIAGAAAASRLSGLPRKALAATLSVVVALQAWIAWSRVPDWRDDRTLFTTALAVDAESWFALFELGHAEARDGRWAEAAAFYRRALRHNRSDARLLSNAAAAFDRTGDYPAAIEFGRLGVGAAPGNPRAHYNLALPLARVRRFDEALAELDTALALAPGYRKAQELREEVLPQARATAGAGARVR